MATPIESIYQNALQLKPAFNDALGTAGHYGYRGDLIITEGGAVLKNTIIVSDEKAMLLFAAELDNFDDFEAAFERYASYLTPDTLFILFVNNLMSNALFAYKEINVYAYSLDESSVWNELISQADLDKRELKRMDTPEKLDSLFEGLKASKFYIEQKSYEEACALKMS
jgi:hypothetical protein